MDNELDNEQEMSEEQKQIRSEIKKGSLHGDLIIKSRPKTSVAAEEAKQYEAEMENDIDIFFTSEVKIQINENGKFINEFKVLDTIGKGSYSKVKLVKRQYLEDGKLCEDDYAMKMIHKPTLKRERWAIYQKDGTFEMSNALEKVFSEIDIWSRAHHQNIVKLFEFIEADGHDYLYLIIELWDLGQLSSWDFKQEIYVRNQKIVDFLSKDKTFENEFQKLEYVAKSIFRDVTLGVEYLHSLNFAHRDIKLDNILFSTRDGRAKLSDFSVSCELESSEDRGYNWEGTVAFTAPESHVPDKDGFLVLPTDIWSIGVSLYTFLWQKVPFYAESELEMQINAQNKEHDRLEGFSETVNDLINKMLNKNAEERPTPSQVLEHPWFSE